MAQENVFMGTKTGLLALVPHGKEEQIQWPEGTRFRQCEKAASGHWVLVTSCWDKHRPEHLRPRAPPVDSSFFRQPPWEPQYAANLHEYPFLQRNPPAEGPAVMEDFGTLQDMGWALDWDEQGGWAIDYTQRRRAAPLLGPSSSSSSHQ